jgi:hypothetical protein
MTGVAEFSGQLPKFLFITCFHACRLPIRRPNGMPIALLPVFFLNRFDGDVFRGIAARIWCS